MFNFKQTINLQKWFIYISSKDYKGYHINWSLSYISMGNIYTTGPNEALIVSGKWCHFEYLNFPKIRVTLMHRYVFNWYVFQDVFQVVFVTVLMNWWRTRMLQCLIYKTNQITQNFNIYTWLNLYIYLCTHMYINIYCSTWYSVFCNSQLVAN